MAELTIQAKVWQGLVREAKKRQKDPEALAGQVLREFLERQADEDLLERSAQAVRQVPLRVGETEETIRLFRKRKKP